MKKSWSRPQIIVVEFAANEYVSSCREDGSNHQLFHFICDCDRGIIFQDIDGDGILELEQERDIDGTVVGGWLWGTSDGNDHWTAVDGAYGADKQFYFNSCDITHSTPKESDFTKGFWVSWDDVSDGMQDYTSDGINGRFRFLSSLANIIPVILYGGEHATTNLDIESWEAAKS